MASTAITARLQSRIAKRRNLIHKLEGCRTRLKDEYKFVMGFVESSAAQEMVAFLRNDIRSCKEHIAALVPDQKLDKKLLEIAYDDEYSRRFISGMRFGGDEYDLIFIDEEEEKDGV